MPHKRTKAVGKLLFFDNKKAPRSIDRFGFIGTTGMYTNRGLLFVSNRERYSKHSFLLCFFHELRRGRYLPDGVGA